MSKRKRAGVVIGVGVVLAIFHPYWFHPTRYGQLKCVINHHTGFAHFTRGMGLGTINALRQAVGPQDISILVHMLDDRDDVTQMTAAQVLARLGEPGLQALRQELAHMGGQTGANFYRYQAVQEALADSGDKASVAYVQATIAASHARIQQQYEERRANDARVQANSLKLLDPRQKYRLSHQEREEIFQQSVKATGLNGPRTPQQERLYRSMYHAMILDQSSSSMSQQ